MPRPVDEIAGDTSSIGAQLHAAVGPSVMKIDVIVDVAPGRRRHFMPARKVVAAVTGGSRGFARRGTNFARDDGRIQTVSHHRVPRRAGDKAQIAVYRSNRSRLSDKQA